MVLPALTWMVMALTFTPSRFARSKAELQRDVAGEVGGLACDCKGGRGDDHSRPAGWGGRR
jgi:hypothetical protein